MKKIVRIFITICLVAICVGCDKDEESAFSGKENSIASFKLAVDDGSLTATISGDQIIIHTVESRSLSGAKASVEISENAKIYPDPASISDWENAQTFVVTSYNGQQYIYHYVVKKEKAEAIKTGNFTLTTQTEVDDFGTLGVEVLDGNITLGVGYNIEADYPEDAIISTAALATLKEVKGTIVLEASFDEENLSGFANLKKVGTISVPNQRNALKSLILPELETVHGSISMPGVLNAMSLRTVYLPKLVSVEGDFIVQGAPNLSSFIVPSLKTVLGDLALGGNGGMNGIKKLSFPKLELIGGVMSLYQFTDNTANPNKIEFPVLRKCGGFYWEQSYYVESLDFPKLEEITGSTVFDREWGNLSKITKISMPNVTYIDDLLLVGYSQLETIDMPKLKKVRNITLGSLAKLKDLKLLGTLETVTGTLSLKSLSGLQEAFAIPSSLTTLNGLAVENIPGLTELDLRGTGIKDIGVTSTSSTPFKLTADDVLDGSLTLSGSIDLNGFKEVKGNVTLTRTASAEANVAIPNTTKIGGNLSLSYTGKKGSISLPGLQEVGGTCTIKSDSPFKADNLTTVKGTFLYDITMSSINVSIVSEFSLPKLKTIDSDFTIYTWARPATQPLDIKMPSLTKINGKLFIRHTDPASAYGSSGVASNSLSNLDGFSALTSLKSVEIWRQGSLKSFKGLKNAIGSFSADNWNIKNCAYNPTYDDMVKGNTEN